VSPRIVAAVAVRVLAQLRHHPRTVALLIVVPALLVTLLRSLFDARPQQLDAVGALLVGLFALISMFLVTSITVLRERTTGTLERLLTMPLAKFDLLGGYGAAFALMAVVQAAVVSVVAFGLLGLDTAGSPLAVAALAVANAVLGMALGLVVSAFAASEFQAVQFMPAFPRCCCAGCSSRATRWRGARAPPPTSSR
jgi:ABC-2 type transport system permease protein